MSQAASSGGARKTKVAVSLCLVVLAGMAGAARAAEPAAPADVVSELRASELAGKRLEAHIQEDQYDLNLRKAAASAAAGQSPEAADQQEAAAKTLAHEIRELRHQLDRNRKAQRGLRARLEHLQSERAASLQPGG